MRVGVEVGGTFTDLVAVEGGKVVVTKVPSTPKSPDVGRSRHSPPRAWISRASKTSGMARRWRQTLCSSARARRSPLSRPRASATCCSCSAMTGATSTTSSMPSRRHRCVARTASRRRSGSAPTAQLKRRSTRRQCTSALVPALKAGGYRAVAICLLNAYANPVHEKRLAALITEALPDVLVTASHQVAREFREFERASTTLLSAYVQPVIDGYLHRFESKLADAGFKGRFTVMQSNGGRLPAEAMRESAITALYSGPGRRRGRRDAPGRALGLQRPHHLRHGRHLDRRLPGAGRPAVARLGERDRRPADPHARARHRVGRRRRRLDRLGRRRRHAARRPAKRRRRSRPGLLRQGRHGARHDRRPHRHRHHPARRLFRRRA